MKNNYEVRVGSCKLHAWASRLRCRGRASGSENSAKPYVWDETHRRTVQHDFAGVRVDLDCTLDEQLALAEEIADHFGPDRSRVKDIRDEPHSGYRAVHVWLRLPAGRVEVQIRTLGQSVWANTYERMGDLFGRGIRYGETPDNPVVGTVVDAMKTISSLIGQAETTELTIQRLRHRIEGIPQEQREQLADSVTRLNLAGNNLQYFKTTYIERLRTLKGQLDQIGG